MNAARPEAILELAKVEIAYGGIQAVKVLYELAGRLDDPLRVWNPMLDDAEDRTSTGDPLTGVERPVIGALEMVENAEFHVSSLMIYWRQRRPAAGD